MAVTHIAAAHAHMHAQKQWGAHETRVPEKQKRNTNNWMQEMFQLYPISATGVFDTNYYQLSRFRDMVDLRAIR